jgi:Secretion system C-terminal sorting domain
LSTYVPRYPFSTMNRSLLFGFLGVATVASIGVHFRNAEQPHYAPRAKDRQAAYYRGAFEWLNMMRANVATGQVEPGDHARMAKAVAAYTRNQKKSATYNWIEMGPDNIGGRVRAICVDPNNHQKLWAGSVSGGLFRSLNGANTWERIPAFSEKLVISSIAILGNGHLYVATGCTWEGISGEGGSGFMGDGIFMSADDGASFSHPLDAAAGWSTAADWAVVNRIKADPANPNRLYIAALNPGARRYDETDGSITALLPISGGAANAAAFDVDISGDGSTILYSVSGGDAYLSTNGASSFDKLDGTPGAGFPQSQLGRLELAISPDNADYMYAFAATQTGRMSGSWASTDRGQNWNRIWPSNIADTDVNAVPELDIFRDNQQGAYDNAVAVRPGHPDEVWVGGVELWKTSINGQPNQLAFPNSEPGCFFCVHSDVHEIVFADAATAYIGCDGGVYTSPTGGENFYGANRGLSVTQFYSMGYNANGQVAGGAQDNGTLFMSGSGNTGLEGVAIGGGDGFDVDLSMLDTNIMFTSIYGGATYRTSSQSFGGDFYDSNVPVSTDPNVLGVGLGDFYTNFRLFENPKDQNSPWFVKRVFSIGAEDRILPGQTRAVGFRGNIPSVAQYGQYTNPSSTDTIFGPWSSDTLEFQDQITSIFAVGFTGAQGVWVTRQAENFSAIPEWAKITKTTQGAGGNVTCLEWSADGNTLFWGTSEGEVYRISGFNNAYTRAQLWGDSTATCTLTDRETILSSSSACTGLAPDPSNVNRLVVTYGGYGGSSKVRKSENALDANPTFDNIWITDPSELAGMPVYDAVIHKNNLNVILVGTEFGVWATDDGGSTWTSQTNGIQGVPTFAMRQQTWNWENNPWGPDYIKNPNVIYAGTHGRGIFRTEDLVGIKPLSGGDNVAVDGLLLMPNPASTQSIVSFNLRKAGDVVLNVYNMDGRLVRAISRKNLAATTQAIPVQVADMGTGTYVVEVVSNGQRRTSRMVVSR